MDKINELVESYLNGNQSYTRKKLKSYNRKELLGFISVLGEHYNDYNKAINEILRGELV